MFIHFPFPITRPYSELAVEPFLQSRLSRLSPEAVDQILLALFRRLEGSSLDSVCLVQEG